MHDHYMEQLIQFPTRGDNTLDLILSNRPGLISDCSSPSKLSDHDVIACTLSCAPPIKRKAKRKIYLYGKGDHESLRSIMRTSKDKFLNSFSVNRFHLSVYVYTDNKWRMSRHGKIISIIMLQVLSWYHSIILCSNSYHVLTFLCVNSVEYMPALPRGIYFMNHGLHLLWCSRNLILWRTAICLNIIIFVSLKIQ